MKFLLFLTHFIVLLFSAYFLFNFGVRWVQIIGYNLAFNEPVANSLHHSINIYFKLIAITTFSYLFFAIFQRFYRRFAMLLWMAEAGVFSANAAFSLSFSSETVALFNALHPVNVKARNEARIVVFMFIYCS